MAGRGRRAPRRSSRRGGEQLDVTAFLATPVKVGKGGRARQMSAFEVGLRAQVKAALKEQSLRAIRSLIALAARHELFKPPPPPPRAGGVVVWPGLLDLGPGDDVFAHLVKASTSKGGA
jgi:hypothetical protein